MTGLTDQIAIEAIADVVEILKAPMHHEGEFTIIKPLEDVIEYLQGRLDNNHIHHYIENNHGNITFSTNTDTMHVDLTEKIDTQNVHISDEG